MQKYLIPLVLMLTATTSSFSQVQSTVPEPNAVDAGVLDVVIFDFLEAIDPSTVADTTVYAWGRWSGRLFGTVSVTNGNRRIEFTPTRPLFYGEQVTVRLPSSVRMATGSELTGGYTLQFWTGPVNGGLSLVETGRRSTRVAGETFIQSYGAYSGDLDHDGYPDLIVPNERTNDIRIFSNDGSGNYAADVDVIMLSGGSAPSTNEGADFNRDGHTDFAVGNSTGSLLSVFDGNGAGGFRNQSTYPTGTGIRGLCTGDFNADGWEDILTANRAISKVYILLNNADGTFGSASQLEFGGDGESGCAIADVNGDGIEDAFIGNLSSGNISILKGDGNGGFSLMNTVDVDGDPWMLSAGDMNADGVPDVISANSGGHNVSVTLMDSSGEPVSHVEYVSGGFQLAVDLGDLDGDGDLDVVTSNFASKDFTFWLNDGSGFLTVFDIMTTGGAGSCMILHDRDGDGDLDATGIDELDDQLIFFENEVESTEIENLARTFEIVQVFPNPASESVSLEYRARETVNAVVEMYDAVGRRVALLMDGAMTEGVQSHDLDTKILPGGTYFLIARANGEIQVRSLVVVR